MNCNWEKRERSWRRQLLSYAKGNVLEVGVGTGENCKYYSPGVVLTATDASAKTIEKAKIAATEYGVKTNFIISTVEHLELQNESFDTIVSTFSLSAYEDPARVLEQFNGWCKPGGLVLLLEYGLSKYGVVNWVQRKWAPYHYRKTGSHINRDIIGIISSSGLRMKKVEVKYAGIVYLVWATLISQIK